MGNADIWFYTPKIITYSWRMDGTPPLGGGSWGPILQLDLENWTEFLEVLNLICHILDFAPGLFFAGVLLKGHPIYLYGPLGVHIPLIII